ncbi:MAG: NAD+ synthase, partial [Gammaproteobacteria bacterium]|nr:NAD+ synthase [Gammaproteobacteria bacterium]NDE57668.1 NAD+ synthase [Gammaproteobacteria bacterium]NDG88950.1 NAD+ synthase [Gammaproteobacteria bacterium]
MDFPVGDVFGNTKRIIEAAINARDNLDASIIVFPELCLSGYPPEDLLLRKDFMAAISRGLKNICGATKGIMVIVGYPEKTAEGTYNAAAIIMDGAIKHHYRKRLLPNYGVFDEKRYFIPGDSPCVFEAGGQRIGITICEDIWQPGPVEETVEEGATLILNLNASPFHQGKAVERKNQVRARIAATRVPL